uniref:Uncharacterized protein n=1 Tax=Helianthus annuus TaxID=4232 RepID=A0A251U0D2_HELAN
MCLNNVYVTDWQVLLVNRLELLGVIKRILQIPRYLEYVISVFLYLFYDPPVDLITTKSVYSFIRTLRHNGL